MAGKKESKPQQPRVLSPDIKPALYKGGMYPEMLKFRNRNITRKLLFNEDGIEGDELETEVEVAGLDFSVSEDKAFSAIQILLDRTGYQGNLPGKEVNSKSYNYKGVVPVLEITYSEYFDAYGLKKIGGKFQGNPRKEALEALDSLTLQRRICYTRTRKDGRKLTKDKIVFKGSIINIIQGYKNLSQSESDKIDGGKDIAERVTKLIVEFSPLMVDCIDSFYLLKPVSLHKEIEQLLGRKRISRAVSLFIEWLLTKNSQIVKIDKDELIEKLRLDDIKRQGRKTRLEERLQECFFVASELKYLLGYSEDRDSWRTLLTFELNPERCLRIQMTQLGTPTAQ